MSPQGISMEERNDEWGEGCHIDGGSCIGCGDCDDAGSFADESGILSLAEFMIQRGKG